MPASLNILSEVLIDSENNLEVPGRINPELLLITVGLIIYL